MRKIIPAIFIFLLFIDNSITSSVVFVKTPFLNNIMSWLSYLGLGWIQALLSVLFILAGVFIMKDEKMAAAGKKGVYTVIAAGILSQVIKHLIGRPRPKVMDALGLTLGPSITPGFDAFPSGHATSAFAFAYALCSFYPWMRYPLYAYAVLVSISRIYVGAHFPSDVFAGMVLGVWTGHIVTTKGKDELKVMLRRYSIPVGIAVLSIFIFFYNLGSAGLFDVDEAVYAEATREMIVTGDWITPQYNYTNRYDKPVFFYWLMASAFRVFGVTEFAARFWSAVFGVLLTMMCYYFLRRMGHPKWGAITSLVFATSLEVILLAHASITDMTLTFFITSSLFCFFLGYIGGNDENNPPIPPPLNPLPQGEGRYERLPIIPPPVKGGGEACPELVEGGEGERSGFSGESNATRWWYWGFYLSTALAVLTKGPVGVALPAVIIFIFLILRGQLIQTLKNMHLISGAIIFLAVALPWYVIEIWINGWEYIDAFFIKHNVTRFTGVVSGHKGPVYYFIPVILLAFFPWSAFLPQAIYNYFPRLKQKGYIESKDSVILFAVIWFLVIFIFFSISRTKLPGYIAPLAPALAILVGRLWYGYMNPSDESSGRGGLKYSFIFLIIIGLVIAAGSGLMTTYLNDSEAMLKQFQEPVNWGNGLYYITVAIVFGMALFMLALWRHKKSMAFGIMAGMMTVVSCILFSYIIPVADKYLQATIRDFSRIAANGMGTDGNLVVYDLNKPSILFYAQRPVTILLPREKNKLTEVIESQKTAYIISKSSGIESFTGHPDLYILYEQRGYVLAANRPPVKQ